MRKKILRKIEVRESKSIRKNLVVSNSILYLGVIILISALILMIVNLAKADFIITIWLPFMIAGVVLVIVSQFIKWQSFHPYR